MLNLFCNCNNSSVIMGKHHQILVVLGQFNSSQIIVIRFFSAMGSKLVLSVEIEIFKVFIGFST